jgi:hypothetical protein
MLVRRGERVILEVRAKAEPAPSIVTHDYYTQLPQLRLSPNPTSRQTYPEMPTDVTLDDTDVALLVEAAVRHPARNMRQVVLAVIWNHPETFREIFRFGLEAPAAFSEIREIVAEELAKRAAGPEAPAANRVAGSGEALLPRMPLPPHLRKSDGRP